MHGRTYADAAKAMPIAPDAKIKIEYMKTPDGTGWIQRTTDTKTEKQLHSYTEGKGRMKGFVGSNASYDRG
jgi:hypothetical protein